MPEPFDPYHVWLGIPPEEQPPNHYRLLGLRPLETNADVISNALDQRRVFLRSVQAGKRGAQSQQLLNEVSTAGVVLLDSAKKTQYDAELRKKLSPRPAPVHPAAAGLPDPMAPLAIPGVSPLPTARGPAVPTISKGSATVARPPTLAPVIVRPSTRPSSSTTAITAVVLSLAALTLAVIFLGVFWIMSKAAPTTTGSVGGAPAPTPPSLPPSLPPSPSATSHQASTAGQANGESAAPATGPRSKSEPVAVAMNDARPGASTGPPEINIQPQSAAPPQSQSAPAAGSSSARKAESGGRQPVPESDALNRAEGAARRLYANDLKGATKGPQQIALANAILSAGRATQNDFADRFALIDLARTLFVQAGDVPEALTAARLLEIEYDIPRGQLLAETIDALDNGPILPEHRLMMTRTAAELADSAADAQEFERAEKLATIAVQAGSKLRDAEFKKDLLERRNSIVRLVKEWNGIKPSLEKLKSDPQDAAANLAAGKFYCFSLEDFHQGLPYLAACGDGLLAEAAKLDLAAQGDSARRYEAAHAWQKAELKIVDRDDKLAAQRRERWLLQQAVAGLAGIEQMEANKRLAQLQNIGGPAGGRKTGDAPAPSMPAKKKKKT